MESILAWQMSVGSFVAAYGDGGAAEKIPREIFAPCLVSMHSLSGPLRISPIFANSFSSG